MKITLLPGLSANQRLDWVKIEDFSLGSTKSHSVAWAAFKSKTLARAECKSRTLVWAEWKSRTVDWAERKCKTVARAEWKSHWAVQINYRSLGWVKIKDCRLGWVKIKDCSLKITGLSSWVNPRPPHLLSPNLCQGSNSSWESFPLGDFHPKDFVLESF